MVVKNVSMLCYEILSQEEEKKFHFILSKALFLFKTLFFTWNQKTLQSEDDF